VIIADTCLVTHLFNQTALTDIAQKVLEKDSHWLLPRIWQEEYANVLSKLARKEGRDLKEVIEHFNNTVMNLKHFSIAVDNQDALKISIEKKISVYDAHFVLLALQNDIILITEDKEILKNCPDISLSMSNFLKL
jgi:predicted nucleic acid-binding protein